MSANILSRRASSSSDVGDDDNNKPCWPFVVPKALDLSYIEPKEWRTADEVRWVVSTVLHKTAYGKTDADGYVRINSKYAGCVVRRNKLKGLVDDLERREVIEIDRSYSPGRYSRGIRLTDHQHCSGHIRIRHTSPYMEEPLRRFQGLVEAVQAKRRKPIHDALHACQMEHLFIRKDEAMQILAQLGPKAQLCQGYLVENLLCRRLVNSVSNYGRWFNGITGLKGDLRYALRLAGEPMGAIDLRCAQPALLGMLIQALLDPSSGLNDCETYMHILSDCRLSLSSVAGSVSRSRKSCGHFIELVSSGCFYPYLAELCDWPIDLVKYRFLVDMLAPVRPYPCLVRRVFVESFPGVASAVEAVNQDNYREMIRLLQRLESWLVVETVAPTLVGRIPIITLHDAIFGRIGDISVIEDAFRETFDKLEFQIAMKHESYSEKE